MKKLLLITSFLASQLFAIECPEEQYSLFFTDTKEVRYMFSSYLTLDNSRTVIDKKSIKFDKKNQIIQAWAISEMKSYSDIGLAKILYEFDIKNNNWRSPETLAFDCNGKIIASIPFPNWTSNSPESTSEKVLFRLKKHLNLK